MFVDTNILVAARFLTAPAHVTACRCLNRIGNTGEALHISRQIIREYLVAVTRPQSWSAALAIDDALEDAARLMSSFTVLEDGPNVMAALAVLCREAPVAGKQIHDANIAATMLAHSERRLLTLNVKDFRRYGERIEMVDLERAA
jgi:predicted nucleic acid-binding protein